MLLIFAAVGVLFIIGGALLTCFSMRRDGQDLNNIRIYLRERVRRQRNDPEADSPHNAPTNNAPSNTHGPDDNDSHQNAARIESEGSDDDETEDKNKSAETQLLHSHYSHDVRSRVPVSESEPVEPSRRPLKNTQPPINMVQNTSKLETHAEVHTSTITSQNIKVLPGREGVPSTSRQEFKLQEITPEKRSILPRETHQESSAETPANHPPSMVSASHSIAMNSDFTQEESHQESSTEILANHPPSTLSASHGSTTSSDVNPEPGPGEFVEESTRGVLEITRDSKLPSL